MKIIALTILGICCVMIGQYIAYRYNMRVTLLEKSLVMLNFIENNIGFLGLSAQRLINELSEKDELKALFFLRECNSLLQSGADFENAWRESLCKRCYFQPFKKEDIEILQSFSIIFGKTDIEGQLNNCRIHYAMLSEKLNEAKAEQARYSSLFTVFGVLCGICIFIIFI